MNREEMLKALARGYGARVNKHKSVDPMLIHAMADEVLRGLEAGTKTNQCGETCERAKLCYACGKALDESNAKQRLKEIK